MLRAIVTCGPSYEPIDSVRRITNHSTGMLGIVLSNELARSGFDVLCLKGIGATAHEPLAASIEHLPFATNEHLLERLDAVAGKGEVAVVLHAAALCDFKVASLRQSGAALTEAAKISSRSGNVTLVLEPAVKLIGKLRTLFPAAGIAGWKYELTGGRDDVVAKGLRQIHENAIDICVLNGRAYGRGFGVLRSGKPLLELAGREDLCKWLPIWAAQRTKFAS